jgi:uncharacterized protein YabE (DUF348 family)
VTSNKLVLLTGRLGRRVLVLLLVALLAVPVVQAAQRLRVNIDGDVFHVLSFDATVGDVLEEQGVLLAAGDEVLPAPDTPLEQVSAITVLRTIDVTLDVDGATTTHRGVWRSVEGLLADEDITVDATQVLRPAARTPLEDGDTVTITSPTAVTVVADGEVSQLATHLGTVGELLDNAGVEVRADDILSPARTTSLTDGAEITVQRVGFDEVAEEVALPFQEESRATSQLFTDQSRVAQEGEEGLRIDTYRVTVIDGEAAERELVSEEVVREPVTRIVERGTAQRPPRRMADDGSVWYDLAQCEAGGRWDYNGSSGYDGGLQFHPDTWRRNKLSGYPEYAWQASPSQQIEVGKRLQSRAGWGAWPSCARKLGLI